MPELSILMPGIRTNNWEQVFSSIEKACVKTSFEVIFIGPTDVDIPRPGKRFIKDMGNPSRCAQLALLSANGKYVTWGSDDCLYNPEVIDKVMDFLRSQPFHYKNVVSIFYREGCSYYNEQDWYIRPHGPHIAASTPYTNDFKLVMNGFLLTDYLKELGGWDCRFEAWAMGNTELGIRMQRDGAQVYLYPERVMECSHLPGPIGDHAPIHNAQLEHDIPLFSKIYNDPNCVNRTVIDLDNWKLQPDVWERRFG